MRRARRAVPGKPGPARPPIEDLTFNAVDVETANSSPSSICQIGIVRVVGGEIADEWETLVDPECEFLAVNVGIHGITRRAVAGEPRLPELCPDLSGRVSGSVLVSHTNFDQRALDGAFDRYGLPRLQVAWADSVAIARRAWEGSGRVPNFKLRTLADHLGIEFRHHNALEDARAAALVTLRALRELGEDD